MQALILYNGLWGHKFSMGLTCDFMVKYSVVLHVQHSHSHFLCSMFRVVVLLENKVLVLDTHFIRNGEGFF